MILTISDLVLISDILHKQKNNIVATSGCFDILHIGHVSYLNDAKKEGDKLVVLVNSDFSVKKLKGDNRPINSEINRATIINALKCVDYVCIFNEETPCYYYSLFKPDIVVKGGDYIGVKIPEIETLKQYGGKVIYKDYIKGFSTSNIIERIIKG